jgi:hypothetical protein
MEKRSVLVMAVLMVLCFTGIGYTCPSYYIPERGGASLWKASPRDNWGGSHHFSLFGGSHHFSLFEGPDRFDPWKAASWKKGRKSHTLTLSSDKEVFNTWMASPWKGGKNSSTFTLSLEDFFPSFEGTLISAFLRLSFKDDGGWFDGWEYAKLSYGYGKEIIEVDSDTAVIPISRKGLAALNEKGELQFTLTRLFGDFYFKSAELIAKGISDPAPTPTPIPGSMWLFFSALAGSGFLFSGKSRQAC